MGMIFCFSCSKLFLGNFYSMQSKLDLLIINDKYVLHISHVFPTTDLDVRNDVTEVISV